MRDSACPEAPGGLARAHAAAAPACARRRTSRRRRKPWPYAVVVSGEPSAARPHPGASAMGRPDRHEAPGFVLGEHYGVGDPIVHRVSRRACACGLRRRLADGLAGRSRLRSCCSAVAVRGTRGSCHRAPTDAARREASGKVQPLSVAVPWPGAVTAVGALSEPPRAAGRPRRRRPCVAAGAVPPRTWRKAPVPSRSWDGVRRAPPREPASRPASA